MAKATIGQSQDFVLGQGLCQVGPYWALVDAKGNLRVFAELSADSDRPDVRPREAYHAMLSSMFPGWTVRVLQLFWPDPVPRQAFQCQVETCRVGAAQKMNGENAGSTMSEGQALLREGLLLFVQSAPLPFARRTILEFVLVGQNESLAWWEGMRGTLQEFGLCASGRFQPRKSWNWRDGSSISIWKVDAPRARTLRRVGLRQHLLGTLRCAGSPT